MGSRFNIAAWGIHHPSLLNFLMIAILITGVFAYTQLGQRDLPEFAIKVMVVSVRWPGASAAQVELQAVDPLEAKLYELPWLDNITSFSKPGEAFLIINVEEFTPDAANRMDDLWYQVRKKVDDIRPLLPSGIQGPFFNDEFGDIYGILYTISSATADPARLKDAAEQLRAALRTIDNVEKTVVYAQRPEAVYVEIDHQRLQTLGLPVRTISQTLRGYNEIVPAGEVAGPDRLYAVRTGAGLRTLNEIRALPLPADGTGPLRRLGDLAAVTRGYEDPPRFHLRANGQDAVALAITLREGSQMLEVSRAVAEAVEMAAANLPAGIEVNRVADQPAVVAHALDRFIVKLLIAVAIVLAVSYLTLSWRAGLVVATAIPLVLGIVFVTMYYSGHEITRVSLGALVIALGLLVDDAMIVIEMMHVKLEQGWERVKAATYAYEVTAFPMLTGTLIAAAAFLPIYLINASPREILGPLFVVIATALPASWVVAVLFSPYLASRLMRLDPGHAPTDPYQQPLARRVRALVSWCMYHRRRVLGGTLLLFLLALAGFPHVRTALFPDNDRPEVLADIWFPEGSNLEAMQQRLAPLEQWLLDQPQVEHHLLYLGGDTLRAQNDMYIEQPNHNYAKLIAVVDTLENREAFKLQLDRHFADQIPGVRYRVYSLSYGLPFAYPVLYRVLGPERSELRQWAGALLGIVAKHPATMETHTNEREPRPVARLAIDPLQAARFGLTPAGVAERLSAQLGTEPVTYLRDGNDRVAVYLRDAHAHRQRLDTLAQLPLGPGGPRLSQLATVQVTQEPGILWRYDGMPMIRVQAKLPTGALPGEVHRDLQSDIARLRADLPPGYRLELDGELELTSTIDRILAGTLPLVAAIVLGLLMVQTQSFSGMLLVLATAPLALIGIVPVLLLTDLPFGMPSRMGAIALMGIIIRNSIILMDQVTQDLDRGLDRWEAVLESTVRRARPIVLTALAAALAMVPLTIDYFWGPMAVVMIAGLMTATVLTLLVFPALYCAWYRVAPRPPPAVPAAP
ncbi:MAG: efflux RND transporter permease subunit [Pseudomonadota bacterium]|nr:efflux RND transporter permease subunit [Pseudomonadota bacterium]